MTGRANGRENTMESVEACKIRGDLIIAGMCGDGSAWENDLASDARVNFYYICQ